MLVEYSVAHFIFFFFHKYNMENFLLIWESIFISGLRLLIKSGQNVRNYNTVTQ